MYFDKERWKKSNTISLIDTHKDGKKFRLRRNDIPSYIKTPDDAENYCKSVAEVRDAAHVRAARRLEWQSRRFDLVGMIERFEGDRKVKAPNSWENDLYYAKAYVIPYFLNEAKSNSPLLWSDHYREFKLWLGTVEPIKSKRGIKSALAISTQNHCIKSLNNFLNYLMEAERLESVPLCKTHPRKMLKRKSIENVMSRDVQEKIYRELGEVDPLAADFFLFLNGSGMRESEAFGLSKVDLFDELPTDDPFYNILKKHPLESVGFVILTSQVADSVKVREADGTVRRKPLKHRDKMCRAEGRTIPICLPEVWDMLISRWEVQRKKHEQQVYGTDEKNYLLFEGLKKNRYYNALKEACRRAKVREHSPHDSRHTFSTELVGKSGGDYALAQAVLGHRDIRESQGYVHLWEDIQLAVAREAQQSRGLRRSGEVNKTKFVEDVDLAVAV